MRYTKRFEGETLPLHTIQSECESVMFRMQYISIHYFSSWEWERDGGWEREWVPLCSVCYARCIVPHSESVTTRWNRIFTKSNSTTIHINISIGIWLYYLPLRIRIHCVHSVLSFAPTTLILLNAFAQFVILCNIFHHSRFYDVLLSHYFCAVHRNTVSVSRFHSVSNCKPVAECARASISMVCVCVLRDFSRKWECYICSVLGAVWLFSTSQSPASPSYWCIMCTVYALRSCNTLHYNSPAVRKKEWTIWMPKILRCE